MTNRWDILEQAPRVDIGEVNSLLTRFVSYAVVKEKRKRWLELAMKPDKLDTKFSDFWNSLDSSKGSEQQLLKLPNRDLIYHCMDESGYLLTAEQAALVGDGWDGFLFDVKGSAVYFLTHENTYYAYKIPRQG